LVLLVLQFRESITLTGLLTDSISRAASHTGRTSHLIVFVKKESASFLFQAHRQNNHRESPVGKFNILLLSPLQLASYIRMDQFRLSDLQCTPGSCVRRYTLLNTWFADKQDFSLPFREPFWRYPSPECLSRSCTALTDIGGWMRCVQPSYCCLVSAPSAVDLAALLTKTFGQSNLGPEKAAPGLATSSASQLIGRAAIGLSSI